MIVIESKNPGLVFRAFAIEYPGTTVAYDGEPDVLIVSPGHEYEGAFVVGDDCEDDYATVVELVHSFMERYNEARQ